MQNAYVRDRPVLAAWSWLQGLERPSDLATPNLPFDSVGRPTTRQPMLNQRGNPTGVIFQYLDAPVVQTSSGGSHRRRRVEESFAGKSFRNARLFLEEIAGFERE